MNSRYSFQPGAAAICRGKLCTILEAVTASSVLVEFTETKDKEVVPVSKLRPPADAAATPSGRALDSLAPEDLAEAKRRFAIIKPLVRCERRRHEDVLRITINGMVRPVQPTTH